MCLHLTKQEYTQYVIESRMLKASTPVKDSAEGMRLDFITRRIKAYTEDVRHRQDRTKTANPYRLVTAPLVKDNKHRSTPMDKASNS
jgi:hypothetical protein